ncbi:MAG: histone deacetylase [Candidatus Latescibacteria bacterium]|nr:histone deacetylase [Candidatus Latescibacterota bacterium]
MRASYSPGYSIPLPPKHPFPMGKFSALHRILLAEGLLRPADIFAPTQASWADLELVHTPQYLDQLAHGTLARKAQRKMGLPWSPALVKRSRLAVQGTIQAARMALADGIAANIAGGTHHAFAGHGEGFCVLNDITVAIRVLRRERALQRALVVDVDVHQGNGTAAICADDPQTYTLSLHGEKNYPFRKMRSSRDVGLPDGTDDDGYLTALKTHLPQAIKKARPDLVLYLAGVDLLANDRFGRLSLTPTGLERRDRFALETFHAHGLPVVLLMSGGYAQTPQATADLHAIAHRQARQVYG